MMGAVAAMMVLVPLGNWVGREEVLQIDVSVNRSNEK
jgi:hypothetical protein